MWRLSTDRGRFAVKELNRDFDDSGYLSRYEAACQVELTMVDSGIEAPRPIVDPKTGRACIELPRTGPRPTTVRVHEWVEGKALHDPQPPLQVAKRLGALLARIHGLELPTERTPTVVLKILGGEYWQRLATRVAVAGLPWKPKLDALAPVIEELESRVEVAQNHPTKLIVSHRDLSPGNVILARPDQPVAVDWDGCGPVVPAYELARTMLSWSGVPLASEAVARTLVSGYAAAGGVVPEPSELLFAQWISDTLSWLDVCIRRAMGERTISTEHQRQSEVAVLRLLDSLPACLRSLERWARWLA